MNIDYDSNEAKTIRAEMEARFTADFEAAKANEIAKLKELHGSNWKMVYNG